MTGKIKFSQRVLSILICAALLLAYVPVSSMTAIAAGSPYTKVADSVTMDGWQSYFLPSDGSLSTENAGGIWTDKSVLTNADAFQNALDINGRKISMANDPTNLLVALSAIASNMTITGRGGVSTDTILVLDISGSMNDGRNDVAAQLVDSANTAIAAMMEAHAENRVGVVLYSETATTMLPLGRYTTTDANGRYLNYDLVTDYILGFIPSGNHEEISVNSALRIEGTTQGITAEREVVGGTYIQGGVLQAMDAFTADSNTVSGNRKPIMVLMSDGAPTYGSNDFSAYNTQNVGGGSSTSDGLGFTTQLTLAYAKQQIKAKYNETPIFYTLALALGNSSSSDAALQMNVATSVMNPSASTSAIDTYWERYNDPASTADTMDVAHTGTSTFTVNRVSGLEQEYVDRFFNADDYTDSGNGSLSEALEKAFDDIITNITLQSAYYPTLVQGEQQHSGFISFIDRIGQFMTVTEVKGIVLGDRLFSGVDLAQNFVPEGGALGTMTNPTALGTKLMEAVQERLGIEDPAVARTVIDNAYYYKQLYYDADADQFSNYIGWYADASGKYVGFWYEGITDPVPANAVSIVKSYGYVGEVNNHSRSDMMFVSTRITTDILTGEETVTFAVPASLIPVVTYNVTLDENDALLGLSATGDTAPIRLVYEVALDPDINEYNVTEKVENYTDKTDWQGNKTNVGPNGEVYFYSNQYEITETQNENLYGYGKVNTYSYFRPSVENDRYYYQEDARIYTDTLGTPATSDPKAATPGTKFYHAYQVYTKDGAGALAIQDIYHELAAATVGKAEVKEGNWYVPAGTVRRDYSNAAYVGNDFDKENNNTNTLSTVAVPYADLEGEDVVFGVTLSNNGRVALMPATGIRITKEFEGTGAGDTPFTFTVSGTTPNGNYTARRTTLAGTAADQVTFTNNTATVLLKAGESIEIIGLPANVTYTVTEVQTDAYKLVTANNLPVTTQAQTIQSTVFRNAPRGTGRLTVSKFVEHNHLGAEFQVDATKEFTFTVTLNLNGVDLVGKSYTTSKGGVPGSVTVQEGSKFDITLKHNEQLTILGLPAGTVATVVEDTPAHYSTTYWINGQPNGTEQGQTVVEAENNTSIMAINLYNADAVYPNPVINLTGTKTLTGTRTWAVGDSFSFQVQKWDGTAWNNVGSATELTVDAETKAVDDTLATEGNKAVAIPFGGNILANETFAQVGTYHYRVVEIDSGAVGIDYDKTIHAFDIYVTDKDYDGKLEVDKVTKTIGSQTEDIPAVSGVYTVDTDFTNNYDLGSVTATIEINKTVKNDSESPLASAAGFRFVIKPVNGNPADDPMAGIASHSSAYSTASGTVRFSNLVFTKEGNYRYRITEVNDSKSGYTYSLAEYEVLVMVTTVGTGQSAYLTVATTVEQIKDDAGVETGTTSTLPLKFQNTYLNGASVDLPITFVNKQMSGRDLLSTDHFTFEILPYDSQVAVLTGSSDALGNVTFDNENKLTFNKVGTYFFNIVEVEPEQNKVPGVVYDKTTFRMEVIVSDKGDSKLTAEYTIANISGNEVNFVNRYVPKATSYVIDGTKKIVNGATDVPSDRPLRYNEFTFKMTQVANANGDPMANAPVYTAKNDLDGKFAFPAIEYTEAGNYYYRVEEVGAGNRHLGVTNTNYNLIVTVPVIDDQTTGELKVDEENIFYGATNVTEIVFENAYSADPVGLILSGVKNIEGRERNESDVYSFELYDSENKLIDTKSNSTLGEIAFDEIPYTETGIHTYTVKEVVGTKGGITYDVSVLNVTVEVLDDLMGKLYTKVTVEDQNGFPRQGVNFTNVYKVTGNKVVELDGTKSLLGKTLTDDMFTFELYQTDETFAVLGDIVDSATNKDGKFTLSVEYTPEDIGSTFYYVAKEKNAGAHIDDITYSNAEYRITVQVEDNLEGGIKAPVTVTKGGASATSLDFVNVYKDTSLDPPKLGDATSLIAWFGVLFASAGGMAGTVAYKKKNGK